ncbi:MAG TPA: hypothetical protein VMH32_22520 [Burkholderiales bacterium]|nr:hypothetical protein [Burkholderiales bacterium]
MDLIWDGRFDERPQLLTEEILRAIKGELEAVEAPEEIIEQLTGRIAFAVSWLIDGVASVKVEGGELSPILTFKLGQDQLLFAGGNSWMHEYVFRILPKLFAQPAA